MKICGEVELRVHQYLLSRSGRIEDIERIYSHPQSFAQTQAWLRGNLPNVEKLPVSSNAEGARRARNADDAAAIAGESAGLVYGLKKVIMRPDRGSRRQHHALPRARPADLPALGHDRTSVLVFIKDQPGALFNVLVRSRSTASAMNRIESRPSHQAKWEYAFFIDLAGHVEDAPMQKALGRARAYAAQVKILGSYPVAVP